MPDHPQRGTLQITEHIARDRERTCVLPRISACSFLSAAEAAPEIAWTRDRLAPIRLLSRNIQRRP
jgi:hypothetical protein